MKRIKKAEGKAFLAEVKAAAAERNAQPPTGTCPDCQGTGDHGRGTCRLCAGLGLWP